MTSWLFRLAACAHELALKLGKPTSPWIAIAPKEVRIDAAQPLQLIRSSIVKQQSYGDHDPEHEIAIDHSLDVAFMVKYEAM